MTAACDNLEAEPLEGMMLQYLAGDLAEDGVAVLNRALRQREALRRQFAHLLLQHVQLADLGREEAALVKDVVPVAPAPAPKVWRLAWAGAFAAAAAVLVAVIGWAVFAHRYPHPSVSGVVDLAGAPGITRGATLATRVQSATLTLGGYCHVELSPHSALRIEGQDRREQVFLQRGKVTCEVDRKVGAFRVRTAVGVVSVTGTKFAVELQPPAGGAADTVSMLVSVQSGAVQVTAAGETRTLRDGQRWAVAGPQSSDPLAGAAAESGTTTGVLAAKGDAWLEVQLEGEAGVARYAARTVDGAPDPSLLQALGGLSVGDRVEVLWTRQDGQSPLAAAWRRIEDGVALVPPPSAPKPLAPAVAPPAASPGVAPGAPAVAAVPHVTPGKTNTNKMSKPPVATINILRRGAFDGVITGKADAWIELKVDGGGPPERYLLRFSPASEQPTAQERDIQRVVAALKIGDRVVARWALDAARQLHLEAIGRKTPGGLPDLAGKSGIATGTVVAVGANWLTVKLAAGEQTYRFLSFKGKTEVSILRQIAALRPGDAVKVRWTRDDQLHVVEFLKPESLPTPATRTPARP